jgi:hypothetical protein
MNPFVTNPQSMGVIERTALVGATMIAFKIVAILGLDPQYTDWIAFGIIASIGGLIGWWQNRPKILAETVANIPNPESPSGKTIVIGSPELAAATPASPTVISSTEHKVIPQ